MRKLIPLVVLALPVLALIGCSAGEVDSNKAKATYDEQKAKADKLAEGGMPKFDDSN
ncbi:MAG: hypothetical protein KIS66_00240 [Fimbriimonadaceae bacterium]|nr:hypothetical protein [Fimbriimonadaceae bacterium]